MWCSKRGNYKIGIYEIAFCFCCDHRENGVPHTSQTKQNRIVRRNQENLDITLSNESLNPNIFNKISRRTEFTFGRVFKHMDGGPLKTKTFRTLIN